MAKRSLLLVDGDARSLRVLEVSLRKAGFVVTTAVNGRDGLEKARVALPDLILSDTDMPEMDGFELCRAVKADPALSRVPFVFLTGQTEIENKIRGLELGVDEYLTKPIYIKEILTRIRLLLQKKQRDTIETRRDSNTRFAGTLHDMGVVDLIQTIEVGRKSGLIHFSGPDGRQGTIYFRNGSVIDAEAGHLQGADAVYRLLTWSEGEFELLLRTVRRKDSIDTPTPGLLMEGMRRLDEWGRLLEQLPPLGTRFEVDVAALAERLADLPDELNDILRLFDGRRSVLDVLDLTRVGDLECLELVSRLYFEELLREVDGSADAPESTDPALDGWLGRKIPPTSELPVLEPPPGEIATDAAAEWDSSGGEPSVEEVWPSLAGGAERDEEADLPATPAIDDDEGPTPPSSRARLAGMGLAGSRIGPPIPPPNGARNGANGAAGRAAERPIRDDVAAGPAPERPGRDEVAAAPAPETGPGDQPRVEFRPSRSTGSFRPVAAGEASSSDPLAADGAAAASRTAAGEASSSAAWRTAADAPEGGADAASAGVPASSESAIDAASSAAPSAPTVAQAPPTLAGPDGPADAARSSSPPAGEPGGVSLPDDAAGGRSRVRTPSGGFAVVPPGDPSSASGRLHALTRGRDADDPPANDRLAIRDGRSGRARSPSGSHPVGGGGAVGSIAVSVPGGLAGAGAGGSVTGGPARTSGGGTSLLGGAPASLRPPAPRATPRGGTGAAEGMDQTFDTSDRTPLPDPVPLGEERSNPGIKSSLGAEVAMVSGELAARRYPRLTDEAGREMVGVAPLRADERGARPRSGDGRPGRGDARPSVELDQELSAAAEVVQVIARRRPSTASGMGSGTSLVGDEEVRPRRRAASMGAVGPEKAEPAAPIAPQAPRVSSMLRAASGRPFARTFVATVAAATLVGALFGLLFWWLGSRDTGPVVAGSAAESPVASRAPVGSGGGPLPVAGAPTESHANASAIHAAPREVPVAASPTSDGAGEPTAAPEPSGPEPSGPEPSGSEPSGSEPSGSEPASPEPPAELLGAADYAELYAQARQARRRRDHAAALDLATRAGRLDPTAQVRTLEAEALLGLEQAARALAVIDDAIEKRPRYAPAWYIKGKIHRALGQTVEARAALNEYLRIDPEGPRADQVIDLLADM